MNNFEELIKKLDKINELAKETTKNLNNALNAINSAYIDTDSAKISAGGNPLNDWYNEYFKRG